MTGKPKENNNADAVIPEWKQLNPSIVIDFFFNSSFSMSRSAHVIFFHKQITTTITMYTMKASKIISFSIGRSAYKIHGVANSTIVKINVVSLTQLEPNNCLSQLLDYIMHLEVYKHLMLYCYIEFFLFHVLAELNLRTVILLLEWI